MEPSDYLNKLNISINLLAFPLKAINWMTMFINLAQNSKIENKLLNIITLKKCFQYSLIKNITSVSYRLCFLKGVGNKTTLFGSVKYLNTSIE